MNKKPGLLIALLATAAVAVAPEIAMAAGLEKASTFFSTLGGWLRAIGISVAGVALMWAGYKFLFQQARFQDISHIIFGSILIGGATEFAAYLLA